METIEDLFHLPDLQFAQFCERKFSLNKGIYNTIDNWFYKMDVRNILDRRKMILQFMSMNCSNKKKVKFGPGGLTKKLENFLDQKNEVLQANQKVFSTINS